MRSRTYRQARLAVPNFATREGGWRVLPVPVFTKGHGKAGGCQRVVKLYESLLPMVIAMSSSI